MTNKYLCIHGHFYQPPRENPWFGAIEYQASASPYHDWNERITRECYAPNTRARVHGQEGRILKLINNYEYMNFNFGPTLLSWLEKAHPWVYAQILAADRTSRVRYQDHGNALAQVYNHIIMPLARHRDKLTQIRWGLVDFRHRFGRPAEGMWLAETAVDTETLGLMAQEGVKFTILSPSQAQSVRPLASQAQTTQWKDVSTGQIDPSRPYRVFTDNSGLRSMDIFFYDGPLSKAVAYEKVLASGKHFLAGIEQTFGRHQDRPRLVSIATDGESYGHHFKFGDLALSWLFHHLEQTGTIKPTNYAFFLERYPPENEVKIVENSSWSCAHGVERWRADCGCKVSENPEWNQAWRGPLREGLEWLADELAAIFEESGGRFFKDPWKARDDYISVLLRPTALHRHQFIKRHATRPLRTEEEIEAFQLMESQRMSLYMFTSCGWFFDDISGLESTQVLKYAARAIDLVQPWAKKDLETKLTNFLVKAKSNVRAYGNGARIYQTVVKPSCIDPSRATAHYALAALIGEVPEEACLISELVHPVRESRLRSHDLDTVLGETQVAEKGTGREFKRAYIAFCCEKMGLSCLVGENIRTLDLGKIEEEVRMASGETPRARIEQIFSRHVPEYKRYGLKDLIPDTRKGLIQGLARGLNSKIKSYIRQQERVLQELVSLLQETGEPTPNILRDVLPLLAADNLTRLMRFDHQEGVKIDLDGLHRLALQAKPGTIDLNEPTLRQEALQFLRRQMEHLAASPEQISMKNVINFLNLAEEFNLELDLWECQNIFHDLYHDAAFNKSLRPDISHTFNKLGRRLGFAMEGE